MKKILIVFLMLCMCLGFCACGQNSGANYNTKEYVGTWINEDSDYESIPQSIQLFSNSKGIIDPYRNNWHIDDEPWGFGCEWMVENNHLVVFYQEDDVSYTAAYKFTIVTSTEFIFDTGEFALTYTKK